MQEVLMKEYNIDKRAYSELYAILQMLGKEYIDKIPEKIYKSIESRKDDTYNPVYNDMEEVLEGRVKRKTVSMLALLDYNYFSTSETDRMYMRYILEENDSLQEMAQIRAEELSIRMSHIRPNGELALGYGVNGEIATKGPKTPKDAFLDWKGSKQHNELMLHSTYLTFGSGYYVDGNGKSYWIVLFSTSPQPEDLRQQ